MKRSFKIIKGNKRYEITFRQGWIRKRSDSVKIIVFEYKKLKNDGFEEFEEENWEEFVLCTKTGRLSSCLFGEEELIDVAIEEWKKFVNTKRGEKK